MPFTKPVIVIDNGSYNIKAGFACDNHPLSIFRNTVGRPKYLKGSYGKNHYEVYIGEDAVAREEELELNYPVRQGKIVHWDNMERVWHHIFYKELKAAPEDRAVLLSCAPTTTMKDNVKCCEIFFEALNAPALCVKPQSVLALFGSGYTTGLSVDIGEGSTEINPIYEGGSISYANMCTNYGISDIKDFIKDCLNKRGLNFGNKTEEVVKNIWQLAYVTDDCAVTSQSYRKNYTLPCGTVIDVSDEAFLAAELYFQPELVMGMDKGYVPIQKAILTSVLKCDTELQTEMYDSIISHGGGLATPGLNKRLKNEIESIINRPVNIIESNEYYTVSWLGGAVFAGMTEAPKLWVTKKQFEDQGEKIVRSKYL